MEPTVLALSARQHGVVGRRQLLARGCRPGQVDGWLHRGQLERVADGVYRRTGAPETVLQACMVAALRCGPDARVVGARLLHGMGVDGLARDAPVVVLLRAGRRVVNVPWTCRPERHPDLGRRVVVDGVPTWSIGRLLLEAAVDESSDELLEAVVDRVRWHRPRGLDEARRLVAAASLHPGARRLRATRLLVRGGPESGPERRLLQVLAPFAPEPQVEVLPGLRVDVLLRTPGLVVEYDGRAAHGGPVAARRDAVRDARLRRAGLLVLHVAAEDLRDEDVLRRRVADLVAVAGHRP